MLTRRSLLAGAAATAWISRAFAQSADNVKLLTEQGRYLPLLNELEGQNTVALREVYAQLLAMTGAEDAALATYLPQRQLDLPELASCRAADAIEAIVSAASTRRLVILNEAHHISRCRAFAERLMVELRLVGYTVFAAETITNTARVSPEVEQLNHGAPITAAQGWYLGDPVFAGMVRTARQLGYHLAAYEARPDQMALAGSSRESQVETREDAEANNFVANVLAKYPKAKVFVYCGYDHVLKAQGDNNHLWFAARLRGKSGLDPLCVSQSWTVPADDAMAEDASLAAILDHFRPTIPVILNNAKGEAVRLSAAKTALDFEVIHPRLAAVEGRPGWLTTAWNRKQARFKLPESPPVRALVQAVPADEAAAAAAVPSDQYPAPLNAREAVFYLKPGRYEVRLESDTGRRVLGPLVV